MKCGKNNDTLFLSLRHTLLRSLHHCDVFHISVRTFPLLVREMTRDVSTQVRMTLQSHWSQERPLPGEAELQYGRGTMFCYDKGHGNPSLLALLRPLSPCMKRVAGFSERSSDRHHSHSFEDFMAIARPHRTFNKIPVVPRITYPLVFSRKVG